MISFLFLICYPKIDFLYGVSIIHALYFIPYPYTYLGYILLEFKVFCIMHEVIHNTLYIIFIFVCEADL